MSKRLLQPFLQISKNKLMPEGRPGGRVFIIVSFTAVLCWIIYAVTSKTVAYFHSQNELGIILSLKIFQMAWITIFAMLIFSSMVTAVSTLYLSKDNEILLAAPVTESELYFMRYLTTSINTSWMMLVFSLPVFGAYGHVFQAGPLFWPLLLLSLLSTAATASATAMLLTVVLVYAFPAKRTKDIMLYLSLCFGIFLYLIFRLMRPEDLVNPDKYGQFIEYLAAISTPAGPWLPAGWATNQLTLYLLDREIDILLTGLLLTTPLVIYFAGELVMKKLFINGFSKSQESFGGHKKFLPPPKSNRTWIWIFRKELKLFLRDSSEWSQLFMIGALIVVYLYNFKALPLDRAQLPTEYIKNLISFGNIGLSGFIAAALAARFVYPSISSEGGAFYLFRTAPIPLTRYMIYKYLFYLLPFTALTLILIVISNSLLQISGPLWSLSLFLGLLICWTVVALAMAFGAFFVDFKAENRAATMGIGVIIYLLCAIAYEFLVIFLGAYPSYRLFREWRAGGSTGPYEFMAVTGWGACMIILSVAIVYLAWQRGLTKLRT